MLCNFHHSFFSPNVLPGLSQPWEMHNSCTFAHQMFSYLVLGIAYNIWLEYHQWFVISTTLGGKWLGAIQSMKTLEGFSGNFWMSLQHEIGHDLTCTLWGEKQWLLLLSPEWICSFVNKMIRYSNILGSTLCAQFCYRKGRKKLGWEQAAPCMHLCSGFMRHPALEALWREHCRCALFIVFYKLHLESII